MRSGTLSDVIAAAADAGSGEPSQSQLLVTAFLRMKDERGNNMLIAAAGAGALQLVEKLLDLIPGAIFIDHRNHKLQHALHAAVINEHAEVTETLLKRTNLPIHGKDAEDFEGYTPVQECTHAFGQWVVKRAQVIRRHAYAAFISHVIAEGVTESRVLKDGLEMALGNNVFLGADDLRSLADLQMHVKESDVLVLIQTKSCMERPWVIVEVLTAITFGVPIVAVHIVNGEFDYNFGHAKWLLSDLERNLPTDTAKALRELGIDLQDASYRLSSTLPNVLSIPFNRNASKNILAATMADIADAVRSANVQTIPTYAEWTTRRQSAEAALPILPLSGFASFAFRKRSSLSGFGRQGTARKGSKDKSPSKRPSNLGKAFEG
jgi:hypothetical protein